MVADLPRKGKDIMAQFTEEYQDAVIYARYSSHAQRDVSIEQQIKACQQFAKRHSLRVLHVYEDRALTGTSDRRPGFQQMVKDAKNAGWKYVIVYTLDRFARNRYDSATYKQKLKRCGVKVLSAMENISDDPTGILMESVLEGLAEYYSAELSRKVLRGMNDNASKCMVNGALPLGYVRGEDGRYAICEAEAEIVREIYRRVIHGDSFADIIRDLNARGILTKKGKPWNRSSFNRILNNERYTGLYHYGEIVIPGGIPAIITQEQFDKVQSITYRKNNPRKDPTGATPQRRRREGGTYLLTGKLFCGHCKEPMIGISGTSHTDTPHYYYTCKGRRADHESCAKRNVRRDAIEAFVATSLRDTMLTDQAIEDLAEAAIAYQNKCVSDCGIKSLQLQLADVDRSISNLISAIEAGIFSATTQARLQELEAKQRDLTRLLTVAKAEAEARLTKEDILTCLKMFQSGDVNSKSFQEALFDTFLVAAYVYDDSVRFVFTLNGTPKHVKLPFSIDDVSLSNVCITSPVGDQKSPPIRVDFFYENYRSHPDKPSIICGGTIWSFPRNIYTTGVKFTLKNNFPC